MAENEYLIWDSEPNFDEWKDDLQADYPDASDDALYRIMYDINNEHLMDERSNRRDIMLPNGICAVGDLGLWYGRRQGFFKEPLNQITDCLRSFCSSHCSTHIYVDSKGELRMREAHHDGVNYYWFRAYKPGVTDAQKERLNDILYEGREYEDYLRRITFRLGDLIGDVYGWKFPRRPKDAVRKVG